MNGTKIQIWAILLTVSFFSHGACDAFFNYSYDGSEYTISFNNQSSAEELIIQYYWDLGDGNTNTSANFIHTYQNQGIYNVSLTIITVNSCVSSFTRTIYVGIEPTSDTCNIEIDVTIHNATYPDYNNAWISVVTEDPLIAYQWSTGSNNYLISSLEPGFYTLTITNNYGCIRTEVFEVGYNNNCFANFLIDSVTYNHTPGAFRFQNYSSGEISSYYWDFGDGTYSNLRNPFHVFTDTGTYNVCLYIETYYSCSHVYCADLVVHNNIPPINIQGNVFAGTSKIPLGMAVLYEKNDNNYKAINKCIINNGEYSFDSLSNSKTYIIHAIPEFGLEQIYFPKYLPAYYSDAYLWQSSTSTILPSQTDYDIYLPAYNEIYFGEAKISGTVFLGEQSWYAKPVFHTIWFDSINNIDESKASNIVVMLLQNNQIIDFCLTDNQGNYEFNNLPWGEYILKCEKAGMLSQEKNISLNNENPEVFMIDFILRNSIIHTDMPETIEDSEIKIYPNPFNEFIKIESPSSGEKTVYIISVRTRWRFKHTVVGKSSKLDLSFLEDGVYIIVVKEGEEMFTQKMLKKS
jgi:PKD repeat protein